MELELTNHFITRFVERNEHEMRCSRFGVLEKIYRELPRCECWTDGRVVYFVYNKLRVYIVAVEGNAVKLITEYPYRKHHYRKLLMMRKIPNPLK